MLWVLVGEGANALEIPALVWTDKEVALNKCKELLGEKFKERENNGKVSYRWNGLSDEAIKNIYTHYYDGCGGCDAVTLQSIEEGTPFVGWDLD